jgi:choline kinase
MIKQAIILAAGKGRRLWPYTQDLPKCLLNVGGKTIIEHQVDALYSQKVERITVVTGYLGDKVRDVLGPKAHYIENAHFGETSSMYSLWLAREVAEEGFLVINGDVLFHVDILKSLLLCPHPDALVVDFDAILDEEEMKVMTRGERVFALSKTLPEGNGENVGMIKFSAKGSQILFTRIGAFLQQGLNHVMVPYAVDAIASIHPLVAVPVHGLPWIEMDFPEDYQRAQEVIYPAILQDLEPILSPPVYPAQSKQNPY